MPGLQHRTSAGPSGAGSLKSVGTALGADPTDRTDASTEVRIAGLAQPTLETFTRRGAEGTIDMGFAELPATVVAGIVNLELLVHAWDFAKAIGQELHVSDVVSDHVTGLAEETISDQVRASGRDGRKPGTAPGFHRPERFGLISRREHHLSKRPEVDAWFAERAHPLEETMQLARELILSADDRITESIKWKTPTFSFKGDIVSFNPAKKFVSLMFHRGAEVSGHYPRPTGDSRLVRVMRFKDTAKVREAADELQAVIRAWCADHDDNSPAG